MSKLRNSSSLTLVSNLPTNLTSVMCSTGTARVPSIVFSNRMLPLMGTCSVPVGGNVASSSSVDRERKRTMVAGYAGFTPSEMTTSAPRLASINSRNVTAVRSTLTRRRPAVTLCSVAFLSRLYGQNVPNTGLGNKSSSTFPEASTGIVP